MVVPTGWRRAFQFAPLLVTLLAASFVVQDPFNPMDWITTLNGKRKEVAVGGCEAFHEAVIVGLQRSEWEWSTHQALGAFGRYDAATNTARIARDNPDGVNDILVTVAHEAIHAMANNLETEEEEAKFGAWVYLSGAEDFAYRNRRFEIYAYYRDRIDEDIRACYDITV